MNYKQGVEAGQLAQPRLQFFAPAVTVAASNLGVAGALTERHTLEVDPAALIVTADDVQMPGVHEVPEEEVLGAQAIGWAGLAANQHSLGVGAAAVELVRRLRRTTQQLRLRTGPQLQILDRGYDTEVLRGIYEAYRLHRRESPASRDPSQLHYKMMSYLNGLGEY